MNGRIYDPRFGRFLNADPIVQAPDYSQSYNRYSYVFNSPLSFTDPSGYAAEEDFVQDFAREPGVNIVSGDGAFGGIFSAVAGAWSDRSIQRYFDLLAAEAALKAWRRRMGIDSSPSSTQVQGQSHAQQGVDPSDSPRLVGTLGPKTLQGSIELGGEGFFGVFGASKSTGFIVEPTTLQVCRATTTCGRVGVGIFLGAGAEGTAAVSDPLETGVLETTGVVGRIGLGTISYGGSLNIGEGGIGAAKALLGVGAGFVVAGQQCKTEVVCE